MVMQESPFSHQVLCYTDKCKDHHQLLRNSANHWIIYRLVINPLSPNGDLWQIFHCIIKGLSAREVMRIENMITHYKLNSLDFLTASPHFTCMSVRNIWRREERICILILGPNGFRHF